MASLQTFLAALLIVAVAFDPRSVNAKFSKSMSFYWGANNSAILGDGDDLQLVLNRKSGSGVKSKRAFLFGSFQVLLKLVPGNSAGTVTTYYVSAIIFHPAYMAPDKQGMRAYSSLWNADNWATQGGRVQIDWTAAPFIARYRTFRARACKWNGPVSINQCASNTTANWWTSPAYSKLSSSQLGKMKWVSDNYMIYNYCTDTKRFNGQVPPECFKAQF